MGRVGFIQFFTLHLCSLDVQNEDGQDGQFNIPHVMPENYSIVKRHQCL